MPLCPMSCEPKKTLRINAFIGCCVFLFFRYTYKFALCPGLEINHYSHPFLDCISLPFCMVLSLKEEKGFLSLTELYLKISYIKFMVQYRLNSVIIDLKLPVVNDLRFL